MPNENGPREDDDLAWIRVDNGRSRKAEARTGGNGCLVLVYIGVALALAACAGWVVNIWQRVL